MEKTILVFYVNMKHIPPEEWATSIRRFAATATSDDLEDEEHFTKYFIPVLSETRVECLNVPIYTNNKEELKGIDKKIKEIDAKLDRFNSKFMISKRELIIEKVHRF